MIMNKTQALKYKLASNNGNHANHSRNNNINKIKDFFVNNTYNPILASTLNA